MTTKYLKNVVTLKLNSEKCKGCGICLQVCPHNVFEMNSDKSVIKNKDSCMECGACAKNCPFSAIEVDAGVGCAYAILKAKRTGGKPECGCSDNSGSCCG